MTELVYCLDVFNIFLEFVILNYIQRNKMDVKFKDALSGSTIVILPLKTVVWQLKARKIKIF